MAIGTENRADLSPKPCSMITVPVCFLAGGTINGGAAILDTDSSLLKLMDRLKANVGVVSCQLSMDFWDENVLAAERRSK